MRQAERFAAEGKFASAIALYRQLLSANPFDMIAVSALGDLYVKADKPDEAIKCFGQYVDYYLKNGSTNGAIYVLKKILKLEPMNAAAHWRLGDIYEKEGELDKAHDCFIEAGAAFSQQGNLKPSIEASRRALAANPESRQARAALAALQAETAPPPRSVVATNGGGDLAPIFITISDPHGDASAKPRETGATSYGESTAPPDAFARDEALLSGDGFDLTLDPDAVIQTISRAELLIGYGKIDEAIACLRETIRRTPADVDLRVRLKDVYLRAGMIERASEECLNVAGLYASRGDSARARDFMIRAELISARALE